MEKKISRKNKVIRMIMLFAAVLNYAGVCFAAENEDLSNEILSPLYVVLNLFIAVLQVIGILQVVKYYPDLANGIKDQDFTTGAHGAKGVAGGMILFFIRAFLKLIGVTWIE